ncbi:glycosyltransferase family 8 protein [Cristinia sonorae]|uniref:glycogenin glucosyltransferase n=1 Tax=Cristinia sonorae TaxID=1940300 RepID=A0A8K0XNQ0_9AGAR|nr:glycosyltransferase family 8 protein [Cristinia sonorae]
MATPYAFVTLVSSDSYLPGALALVAALKELHPTPPSPPEVVFQTVCLVTPETVDVSSIKLLRKNFDLVVGVEIIEQLDVKGLQLLGRLDLNSVLTKLHIFRLTQYSKLIFLDADVLPVRPLSHLFNLQHEFSAVPDVGWPDIFNSGVMVLSPSEKKFEELVELLKTRGSWDGGDQGLLNEWRGNNWHRLSFIYNTTPTAAYTYAPAYERFGSQISAIHFIGPNKPWKSLPFRDPGQKLTEKSQVGPQQTYDYSSLLDRWFDVYDRHYRMATPVSRSNFEVQRYSAAWDDATSANTGNDSSISVASPIAGVYGLEDLRRIATQGYSSMESGGSGANYFAPSEGEYKSMPLEGRIDLMRPRREPSPDPAHHQLGASDNREQESLETPQQKQIDLPQGVEEMRMYTLPTPGPTEIPPAPYHHGHSLPPSETSTPYYGPPPVTYRGEQRRPVHQEEHGSLRPRLPLSQARANESDQYSSEFDTLAPRQQEWHQTKGHGHRLAHRLAVPGTEHQLQDSPRFPPHDPRHDVHEVHPYQPAHDTTDQPAPSDAHWQAQVRHQDTSSLKLQHSPLQRPHQHQPGHRTASHVQHQQLSGRLSPQRRSPVQHHALPHNHRVSPQHLPRSPSPPKLNWNPAVEPPPNTPPVSSAFPIDTYFPNIWDQPPSQNHDATHQTFSANPSTPQRKSPDVFFHPPPPANIPEQLLREGQYANVLGHAQTEASPDTPPGVPTPDRNKVKTVFPWEEKPRHAPRRAFPASDLPPPDKFIEAVKAFPPSRKSINHERPNLQLRTHSPPGGFPPQLSFSNAWDAVPSIQKYASNLLRPRQQSAPLPEVTDNGWRKRDKKEREKWQEQQDASSMDGDDEDEGESDGGESEGMSQSRKQRSRASSSAAAPIPAPSKGKKEYRMRGVQTLSPEMSSKAVQVTILREDGSLRPRTESSDGSLKKSVSVGIGGARTNGWHSFGQYQHTVNHAFPITCVTHWIKVTSNSGVTPNLLPAQGCLTHKRPISPQGSVAENESSSW